MNEQRDYAKDLSIEATPERVFEALTTTEGLSAWWTAVSGVPLAGGELAFTFGPGAMATMRVEETEPATTVRWDVTGCHVEDWVGTTIRFDLEPDAVGNTLLRFRHVGLTPALECYADCLSGWNHFTGSLQEYAETGTGSPNQSLKDVRRREARAAASVG